MSILHSILETGVHLITINRPLHADLAEEVKQTFKDLAQQGARQVVINLEHVSFIDSQGLAALVTGLKLFGGAHNVRLAALQAQPKLLFELTMFDRIFQIFESVPAATTMV